MSLRTKLLIFSIILALIPLGIAGRSMIRITQDELKSSANDELISVANQVAQEIEDFYAYTWITPLTLVKNALENENLGIAETMSLLTEGIKDLNDIVALQISVTGGHEPLLVAQDAFSQRIVADGLDPAEALKLTPTEVDSFKQLGEIFVGDLRYIKESDIWIMTILIPLKDETFGIPAALSARINLSSLVQRISEHSFNQSGFISVINPKGRKLFDPASPDLSDYSVVATAVNILNSSTRTMGVKPYVRPTGQSMLAAYAFPSFIDWGIIVEKDKAAAYSAIAQMINSLLVWLSFGIGAAILGAIFMAVSLTKPLLKLTVAAKSLAGGNLSTHVEGKERKDEIGTLSTTFNKMVDDLNNYIDELTETTKAKERAESELKLAWDIQQSFLPDEFPEMAEIDVYGTCEPAKEVGGDYYDFFPIDEENYALVIGDVSGKGVPASLFMAVSRTLLRMLTLDTKSPEIVMEEFNDRLVSLDDSAKMFITIFYGIYNIKTGNLKYSSAGHNMPFYRSTKDDKNDFQMLPPMNTMVAGIMDGMPMKLDEINLSPGDQLVLYTDGMTEAIDTEEQEYGEERMEELLNQHKNESSQEICTTLVSSVQDFQKEMPQFDDITLFVMNVK